VTCCWPYIRYSSCLIPEGKEETSKNWMKKEGRKEKMILFFSPGKHTRYYSYWN
jgi:hypothetical protein